VCRTDFRQKKSNGDHFATARPQRIGTHIGPDLMQEKFSRVLKGCEDRFHWLKLPAKKTLLALGANKPNSVFIIFVFFLPIFAISHPPFAGPFLNMNDPPNSRLYEISSVCTFEQGNRQIPSAMAGCDLLNVHFAKGVDQISDFFCAS
jgi:hypothetical protein